MYSVQSVAILCLLLHYIHELLLFVRRSGDEVHETESSRKIPGSELACYFCSDVVAPTNVSIIYQVSPPPIVLLASEANPHVNRDSWVGGWAVYV